MIRLRAFAGSVLGAASLSACHSAAADPNLPIASFSRTSSSLTVRYDFRDRAWVPKKDQPAWVGMAYSIFQYQGPPRLRVTLLPRIRPGAVGASRAGDATGEFRPVQEFDGRLTRCSSLASGGCLILVQPFVPPPFELPGDEREGRPEIYDLIVPAATGLDKDGSNWLICHMKPYDNHNTDVELRAVHQCITFFAPTLQTRG